MRLVRFAVLATLVVPLTALAQSDSERQEQMAPQPVPTELQELDWMVGEWDAKMRWEASEMGPAGQSTGTETVKEGPGGQSHLSSFEGQMEGRPFEGHGVTSYDPQEDEYITAWTDSYMPGVMVMEGKKRGDRIVFEGDAVGPDGKEIDYRSTISDMSPDSYRMTMERKTDDGQWEKSFTIDYTKKE